MTSTHPFWIVVGTAIIAMIPILIGIATSYIKISIVLGLLRSGLGAQQVPGAVVVMALSAAMTLYIMNPTITSTAKIASTIDFERYTANPSLEGIKNLAPLMEPWREFMRLHSGERELHALRELGPTVALTPQPAEVSNPDLPVKENLQVLTLAFVLTELKESFAMGFVLLLPFLVVDLVVANVLAGMGMFMVSPAMISLPLKLILFVVADGWLILTRGLIGSYGG